MQKWIVLIYNSLKEPLFEGNLFYHITKFQEQFKNESEIVLITFEQEQFEIKSNDNKKEIQKELLEKWNIKWARFKWHKNYILKIINFFQAFFLILFLRFKGYKKIASLGTTAGTFSIIIARILNIKHFAYQYEPHSEYLRDAGKLNGWLLNAYQFIEFLIAKHSEVIATTTTHMYDRLMTTFSFKKIHVIPSVTNDELFTIQEKDLNLKMKLGFDKDDRILIYVGKFGDLYCKREIPLVFSYLNKYDSRWKLLVITLQDIQFVESIFNEVGLKKDTYKIVHNVSYKDMSKYINIVKMGLIILPFVPSKKFCSPIKTGEYLCGGIPYITNNGVSNDDEVALKYDVGIVLNEFTEDEIKKNLLKIEDLIQKDRMHFRKIGIKYRGSSTVTPKMIIALKQFIFENQNSN